MIPTSGQFLSVLYPSIGALALGSIVSAAGQFILVVAITFLVLCLVASFVKFNLMLSESRDDVISRPLAATDALQVEMTKRLADAKRRGKDLALIMFRTAVTEGITLSAAQTSALMGILERELRERVRRDEDWLHRHGDWGMAVLAPLSPQHATRVAERLLTRIHGMPVEIKGQKRSAVRAAAAMASYPTDGMRALPIIEKTQTTLQSAADGHMVRVSDQAKLGAEQRETAMPGSVVDELTGALRGDRLEPAIQRFIAAQRKEEGSASLLYIDLDYLKRYNDHYGEAGCNAILQSISSLLQQNVREEDIIARASGEEFAILMGCDEKHAASAGIRLINQVKKSPIRYDGAELKVSISIGLASCPHHAGNSRDLLESAQRALEYGRSRGRAMCTVYHPSMRSSESESQPLDRF